METAKERSGQRSLRRYLPVWGAFVLHIFVQSVQAAPLFHQTIRINPGQVSGGPLTDFPLLFSTTDPALRTTVNGGAVINPNGWDIIFATTSSCADSTTCGGNKLDHEIETYNATTGQLIAWVRVPSLDNGTVLYLHYGDSSVAASTENRPGVWNSTYKGVWHLKETPPATAIDSTANANDGTPEVSPVQTAGKIDGSLSFDGTSDRDVNIPNAASLQLASQMTISSWVQTTSGDGQARLIVAKWKTPGSANYWLGKLNTTQMAFGADGGGAATAFGNLALVNDGAWHHVVGVAESGGTLRIYVDGVARGTAAFTPPIETGTSEVRIGRSPDVGAQDWDGGIDEVRIQDVARSADWIATEYRNQSAPSTFYSMDTTRVLSGSYIGDGVDGRLILTGFQPDVVFVKRDEDTRPGLVRTATMVGDVTKDLEPSGTAAFAGGIKSLAANGFTLGTDPRANAVGASYYWVAFRAADGEMKLGSYSGNDTDNTDVAQVGFQPDYVIVIPEAGFSPVQRSSSMAGDTSYDFYDTELGPPANAIQQLQPDGFQIGNDSTVNSSAAGGKYHYVAWKKVSGRMDVGTYTGNGTTNPITTLGSFSPEWVLVKRTGDGGAWVHKPASTGAAADYSLFFTGTAGFSRGTSGDVQQITSVGFQVTAGPEAPDRTNGNLVTYHYVAFGPHTQTNLRSIGTAANDTTGTVSVTRGSTSVMGTLTDWKTANRGRGDRMRIGGVDYVVAQVVSDTQLYLMTPYLGATASGLGYTLARQFATLQSWENCVSFGAACAFFPVSSANLVADNRREIGIAYKDSVFTLTSGFTINGATTDANHTITLTADGINRHNGTPGSGVIVDQNLGKNEILIWNVGNVTLEWLELRRMRAAGGSPAAIRVSDPGAVNVLLQNLLIHDFNDPTGTIYPEAIRLSGAAGKSLTVRNTMIWDGDAVGIQGDEVTDTLVVENCSIDNLQDSTSSTRGGIYTDTTQGVIVRNTIATRSGTDFNATGGSFAAGPSSANNTSSDGTAPGASPQTGVAASAVFVAPGSDLHLLASPNPALDTGLDLSSSFKLDVDGQTRPAGAGWDRGADEFGAVTAVTLQSFIATGRDGAVELTWTTASERLNLGFFVYRSTAAEGPFQKITASMIPGLGSSSVGAVYRYLDSNLQNGRTYYYELEDVETTGKTELHGPVPATPSSASSIPPPGPSTFLTYGDSTGTSLEVIRQSAQELVLELRTGGFVAEPQPDGSVRISIPGFSEESEPGAPGIPLKRSWIPARSGRGVRVASVREEDVEMFSSLRIASAEATDVSATSRGTVRARSRRQLPGAAFRRTGMYPEAPAQVVGEGYEGEAPKALLELAPLRWNRSTGELSLARRLVVRLVFTGRERSAHREDHAHERRDIARRLVTRERGLYVVGYDELFGTARTRISASSLRLSRLGETVRYHLEPDDGSFGPGSRLYFMSEGAVSNPYGNEAVYELELNQDGERMTVSSASPSGKSVSFYWKTVQRQENHYYQAALLDAGDLWLWDPLFAPVTKSYSFEVSALASISEPARFSVWLQGASDTLETPDHHLRIGVNGTWLADSLLEGKEALRLSAEIPPGVLIEGENTLQIENVGDTRASYSMVMLDRFEVIYPRWLEPDGAMLRGSFSRSGVAEVSGLSRPFLLDVTGSAPSWLGGLDTSPTRLRFRVEQGRDYLVVDARGVLKPELDFVSPSGLKDATNGADYLIVGPRKFLAAANPLLDLRRRQGLRARSVAIEDVYSEFGFGESTPESLRDFLSFAYHHWRKPAPRYVLLLGDATYDFKDYLQTGVKNQVPPMMVKTRYLWTASDPTYAAVNGDDDLPDLAIGRLPAASAEQARVMLEKILEYEKMGSLLQGPVVLVADNPDDAGDFVAHAEEIAGGTLVSRNPRKIYLSLLGRQTTRDAILDAFDQGASMMSYLGHGGIQLWANEDIFDSSQVVSLAPQPRQPLLLTFNCLNGYFQFPYFDSLAEALVKAEGKGAVAAFSPSGLSLDEPAHLFHQSLLRELVSGRHRRLGDAILAAQADYAASGAYPDLLVIYHLLGDPALVILP